MEEEGLIRLAVPVNEDDHIRGPADAPVTLVEYGDFECPFCGMAYPVLKELEARYPRDLRLVFRHFPLEQHPHAEKAAEASEFAADAALFWPMHDRLFEHQDQLDVPHLAMHVRALGLDPYALEIALREQTYAPIVEEMKEGGEEAGIPGTPALFLNGVLFEEAATLENLTRAVDWLLEHGVVS